MLIKKINILDSIGILLCALSMLLFDSQLIKPLSAKGNIGLVGVLSLMGLLLIIKSRVSFKIKSDVTKYQTYFLLVSIVWCAWIYFLLLIHGMENWTVIGFFNVFIQTIIVFLMYLVIHQKIVFKKLYRPLYQLLTLWGIAICITTLTNYHLNDNWIAILGVSIVFLFTIDTDIKGRHKVPYVLIVIIVACNFFILGSRGSTIMLIIFYLTYFFYPISRKLIIYLFLPLMITGSMVSGSVGSTFFTTDLYHQFDRFSRDNFGKSLAVSRFERWVTTENALTSDDNIKYFGVGPSGFTLDRYSSLKASHNTFQDIYFFTGQVGWLLKGLIFFMLIFALTNEKSRHKERYVLSLYMAFLLPTNFYGFLGFTHLAGTLPLYVALAFMIKYVSNKNDY